jgi:hypothetical protein
MFLSKGFPRFIHLAAIAAVTICIGRLVLLARTNSAPKVDQPIAAEVREQR